MSLRRTIGLGLVMVSPVLLAACAGSPPSARAAVSAPPPFYIGGGAGSQHGNFISLPAGETTGPGGVPCTLYVWDRPLTGELALRLRSESCEAPDHPGLFIAHELDRTVIPLASSTLAQGGD